MARGTEAQRAAEQPRLPSFRRPLARLGVWLREPFVIGPDDCPIAHRWAIIGGASPTSKPLLLPGFKRWTLKVHHFMPDADDRDVHDHPWAFVTIVLRGGYDDLVPCPLHQEEEARWGPCPLGCEEEGVVLGDRMRAGTVRYRGPHHRHRTRTGPRGAWTVVVTGNRLDRPWGFFPRGHGKVPWDEYFALHGEGRCD